MSNPSALRFAVASIFLLIAVGIGAIYWLTTARYDLDSLPISSSPARNKLSTQHAQKDDALSELSFARETFFLLLQGDLSVSDSIDWESFRALDMDVGRLYLIMPNDIERRTFRSSFISSFSSQMTTPLEEWKSFNWKVIGKNNTETVLSVVAPRGSLLLTVSSSKGRLLLTTIRIEFS